MKKHYTDQERYEHCRKCRLSEKSITTYAMEAGINRSTFSDWMRAYKNINGKFINVKTIAKEENQIIKKEDVIVNILSEDTKNKKGKHFERFDHSIVEIEYKGLKIATSLEQAEKILEKLYDRI